MSLDKLRSEYPGATVKTSTFDAFIKDVEPVKAQLPVVDLEVGDTWMYGSASDPIKMAINRGLQRVAGRMSTVRRPGVQLRESGDPKLLVVFAQGPGAHVGHGRDRRNLGEGRDV